MDTPEAVKRRDAMVADGPPLRTPPAILFYDGTCGLCDRTVAWLLRRDRRAALRFAPLDGATAAQARARVARWPVGVDSVVLVEDDGTAARATWRTAAVAGALARLPSPWPWAAWALRVVPRPIADAGYDLVARLRRRLAPPPAACARLPEALRDRILP
jgi:predicted DCC family thiol-disulfide oxidoreductase YuxK